MFCKISWLCNNPKKIKENRSCWGSDSSHQLQLFNWVCGRLICTACYPFRPLSFLPSGMLLLRWKQSMRHPLISTAFSRSELTKYILMAGLACEEELCSHCPLHGRSACGLQGGLDEVTGFHITHGLYKPTVRSPKLIETRVWSSISPIEKSSTTNIYNRLFPND